MSAQLGSDMATVSAVLARVKKQLGPDRFAAVQKVFQKGGSRTFFQQQDGSEAEHSTDAAAGAPPSALRHDDTADILALARAAGIGRFLQ